MGTTWMTIDRIDERPRKRKVGPSGYGASNPLCPYCGMKRGFNSVVPYLNRAVIPHRKVPGWWLCFSKEGDNPTGCGAIFDMSGEQKIDKQRDNRNIQQEVKTSEKDNSGARAPDAGGNAGIGGD